MKIEYLQDGAAECPLIRLCNYRAGDWEHLRNACRELADGRRTTFALHEQPWVEPIGGCQFTWRTASRDAGVLLPLAGGPLTLDYSAEAWREVEEKILPLLNGSGGFNWLTNEGDVEVLLSSSGAW